MRDLCIVQIQLRKHVLRDHVHYTAPTQQRELGHTDQEYVCPEITVLGTDHTDGLSDVWNVGRARK